MFMKINPLENKIAESKTTQNKRNNTHSIQINENNSTNNNKIVEIQISNEAKKLNQTDSKKEKNYEITVSQVKIKDQKKDSEQGKVVTGGVDPALEMLIAKLAEILAKIAELSQKMVNASEQMQTLLQNQIAVLDSQASAIEAQIQELKSQE